jgi:pilus assembly protein CpaE
VAGSQGSDAQVRLLVVEDMPQVANYIRSLLDSQTRVKLLEVVSDGRQVLDQIREQQPDMLIIDALMQGKLNGLQVAHDIREAGIDLPIIALTVAAKPISIGENMGSTRSLAMPFSGFDFMHLVQELHDEYRASAPDAFSRVYSIRGAKGGVGTTTLAYNIAAAIAAQGQYRVALIDGSLQFGDLRALLKVPEDVPSILQLPTTKVQKADVDEVMYRDASGAHVLLAPPRIEMAEMVIVRDLEKLISLMRRLYNVILIDTATAIDDIQLSFLDASDQMIEVVTYEHPTLYQARQLANTLTSAGYPAERIRYLVNRADSTGGLPHDAIAKEIGRKPDFEVVSDGRLVAEANNRAQPFVTLKPDAQISKDVRKIATELTTGALAHSGAGART